MTKTQAKKQVKDLLENGSIGQMFGALCNGIEDVESLISDVEETIYGIEPYENKNDLTPQQEERQEWFENLQSILEELKDCMEELQSKVNDLEELE